MKIWCTKTFVLCSSVALGGTAFATPTQVCLNDASPFYVEVSQDVATVLLKSNNSVEKVLTRDKKSKLFESQGADWQAKYQNRSFTLLRASDAEEPVSFSCD